MMPAHLQKYVVEQNYAKYTAADQAVWRYIMRQLRAFLSEHAHPCYLEGLRRTGISVDEIPHIEHMSEKMREFGWQAVPVSGFIPPAAFMEMQALGYLPIASDLRSIGHLMYTPAPDIVHEAAGHAPILVDPTFASYLKQYALVAKNAIISSEDLEIYEAIRLLSDVKENPDSSPEDIKNAELALTVANKKITHISEAAYLARLAWWTSEYGLIGESSNPKIFGAGLLSSVGEARSCLLPGVPKIPLSIDCIEYSYDITEPQPQLFITKNFDTLGDVIQEFAKGMAFKTGGRDALKKSQKAATVNTVVLDSGLQISGILKAFTEGDTGVESPIVYLQMQGRTQLSFSDQQLIGHGPATHSEGFGSPLGLLKSCSRSLADCTDAELRQLGIQLNQNAKLQFRSGIEVSGLVRGWLRSSSGKLILLSLQNCTVRDMGQGAGKILFDPAWGFYDMAVGTSVVSVFGGPADRERYGDATDFESRKVALRSISAAEAAEIGIYQELRILRSQMTSLSVESFEQKFKMLAEKIEHYPESWLLRLELLELAAQKQIVSNGTVKLRQQLLNLARAPDLTSQIEEGLSLLSVP